MSSTLTVKTADLGGIGTSLASALAGAVLGGGGGAAMASRFSPTNESPENRKARVIKSILTGAAMGGTAAGMIPAGISMLREDERGPVQKTLSKLSPLSAAVRHPGIALGGAGTLYAGSHAKKNIINQLLKERLTTAEGRPVTLPKEHLFPTRENPESTGIIKDLISQHAHRTDPAEVNMLYRAAKGRSPVDWKDILGSMKFWKPEVAKASAGRLGTVAKILASTKIKGKYLPVSAPVLMALAGLPLAMGYGAEKSIKG